MTRGILFIFIVSCVILIVWNPLKSTPKAAEGFQIGGAQGGPISCPAGQYRATNGMCLMCPRGTRSSSGATSCTQCLAGTYSLAGASVCTNCLPGTS
jgi:hypothetical protein